jgi:hypothetical protein
MANKKQYYSLDEIGFVGTQAKVSKSQTKRDMELTSKFFKKQKSRKATNASNKTTIRYTSVAK